MENIVNKINNHFEKKTENPKQIFNIINEMSNDEKNQIVKILLNHSDINKIILVSDLLKEFKENEYEKLISLIVENEYVIKSILQKLTSDDIYQYHMDMEIVEYKTKDDLVISVMNELIEILNLNSSKYDFHFKGSKDDLINLIPKTFVKSDIIDFMNNIIYNENSSEFFNWIYSNSTNWCYGFKPFNFDKEDEYISEHLGIEISQLFLLIISKYTPIHRDNMLNKVFN